MTSNLFRELFFGVMVGMTTDIRLFETRLGILLW